MYQALHEPSRGLVAIKLFHTKEDDFKQEIKIYKQIKESCSLRFAPFAHMHDILTKGPLGRSTKERCRTVLHAQVMKRSASPHTPSPVKRGALLGRNMILTTR